MKKFYLLLFSLVFIGFGGNAFAEQSINNPGLNINDLQPQSLQNPQSGASGTKYNTQDIANDVANSKVLENTIVSELAVTGAPAGEPAENRTSTLRWVIIFGIFLIILMSPALLYKRAIKKEDSNASDSNEQPTAKEPNEETTATNQEEHEVSGRLESEVTNTKQPEPAVKASKPKKKKPDNKQKRGKKKRK